jgi:phage repressor protein C with HTH and peptisase S24 domain
METIADRIRHIRSLLDMTQVEFARFLGRTTRGAVGNWESGGGVTRENMIAIAAASGVSVEWLASGRGEPPTKDDLSPHGPATIVDRNGERLEVPHGGIKEIDADGGLGAGQEPQIAYRQSSDGWQVTDAYRPEPWVLPSRFLRDGLRAPADRIIAIQCQGDSMFPTIAHGDVVFVDTRHNRISPPGLYAIRDVYGELIVKRLDIYRSGDDFRVRITSDNPREASREEPLSEVHVFGRVCGRFNVM